MDIRPLSPHYAVSPQIDAEDMADIAAAGYTDIITNRPDSEVGPEHESAAIEAAARRAGLRYHVNPVQHGPLPPQAIAAQEAATDGAGGPVLAYCRSGTRSAAVWAHMQRGRMAADDILAATAGAGYSLEALRPELEAGEG